MIMIIVVGNTANKIKSEKVILGEQFIILNALKTKNDFNFCVDFLDYIHRSLKKNTCRDNAIISTKYTYYESTRTRHTIWFRFR